MTQKDFLLATTVASLSDMGDEGDDLAVELLVDLVEDMTEAEAAEWVEDRPRSRPDDRSVDLEMISMRLRFLELLIENGARKGAEDTPDE